MKCERYTCPKPGFTLPSIAALRLAVALSLLAGCAGVAPTPTPVLAPEPASPNTAQGPARTLEAFLQATTAQRFDEAFALVSGRWHEKYSSAASFGADFAGSSLAGARLERLGQALHAGTFVVDGLKATLPLGGDRACVLRLEQDRWVVDQLDTRR